MNRFAIFILLLLVSGARADPIADWIQAEEAAKSAWRKMPLAVQNVTFVTDEPKGYGVYQTRQSNVFKPGEKIITYVEPVGYSWKKAANDLYEIKFTVDVILKDDKGQIIIEKKGFMSTTVQGHNEAREFLNHISLSLTDAPLGQYTVVYVLNDEHGKKSVSFEQTFIISP